MRAHSYSTSGERALHVVGRYFVCVELFAGNVIGIAEITIERLLPQNIALPALRVTLALTFKEALRFVYAS